MRSGGRRRRGGVADYEALPAIVDVRDAVAAGVPLVHERFGSNLVFEVVRGDRQGTAAAMTEAAGTGSFGSRSIFVGGSAMGRP